MNNQKGNTKIILILAVLILIVVVGYFIFAKPIPTNQNTGQINQPSTTTTKSARISDKANLYSFEIPADWKVTLNEGAKGVSVSEVIAESPDWKIRTNETEDGPCSTVSYLESGATLQFGVSNQEEILSHYNQGGGSGIVSQKNILVGGVSAVYHVFNEPSCTHNVQSVDAHVNYGGNNYTFSFTYNPAKYPQGETVFMNMLNSIEFTK